MELCVQDDVEICCTLCEATNHFRDCSFKAATRNVVQSFERVVDDEPSEHETILEMVALLKEFKAVSKWL